MKILACLLLVTSCLAATTTVSRDGGAQHSSQGQQGGNQHLSSSYEAPPPPYDSSQLYDQQAQQLPPNQFSFHSFRPNYLEPAWQPQQTGMVGSWMEKGLTVLGELLPVAVSVFSVLAIFIFLGLIKLPRITSISEARQQLGRALDSVDVDHLANTVTLAIHKYQEMFGKEN